MALSWIAGGYCGLQTVVLNGHHGISLAQNTPANTLILMAHLPPPSAPLPEQVLEKDECEKLGMGLFLGVSEASAEPPKFIHLTYTPKGGCSWAAVVGGLAGERGRAR